MVIKLPTYYIIAVRKWRTKVRQRPVRRNVFIAKVYAANLMQLLKTPIWSYVRFKAEKTLRSLPPFTLLIMRDSLKLKRVIIVAKAILYNEHAVKLFDVKEPYDQNYLEDLGKRFHLEKTYYLRHFTSAKRRLLQDLNIYETLYGEA